MIIGIGARRGVTCQEVVDGIEKGLLEAGRDISSVEKLASARMKEDETGLLEASKFLGIDIKFVPHEELNRYKTPSSSQASRFGLTGVAEPSALALSEKKELILRKKVYGRITIAIAE